VNRYQIQDLQDSPGNSSANLLGGARRKKDQHATAPRRNALPFKKAAKFMKTNKQRISFRSKKSVPRFAKESSVGR
jgi:hypothetical protein